MIGAIKKLFGIGPSVDFAELVRQGALIVDVRSNAEYSSGYIKGSINIPLDSLSSNLTKFKDKSKPVITCCASGMRSSAAKNILKSNGFIEVHNGGGWQSLNNKLKG